MDLTSLYRMVSAEAPSVPEQMMRGAANQAALQQADEQLMANKRLRELYERGNPSMQELGAISPEYAQKVQQFNNEQLMQQMKMLEMQGGMEETKRKTQEAKQHTFANTIGPLIENWQEGLGGKQPTQQDLESFKGKLGGALKFLDETYSYKPDVPLDPYHPEHILGTAESLGYASRRSKFAEERQKNELAIQQKMSPGYADIAGRTEAGPYGPRFLPPPPPPPPQKKDIPAPELQFEGKVYSGPEFGKAILSEKDPDRRARMNEYLDAQIASKKSGIPNSQFVTPEEESRLRMEEERQKKQLETQAAGEKKSAELGAETAEETAKKASTMATLPPDEEVYALIKKSLAGNIEKRIKGSALSEEIGIGTEANTATAELTAIQEQLRSVVKALYTPGAITKDEQEKMETAIGAIDAAKDADSRIAGYRRFMDMARKSVTNHPELAGELEKITGNKIFSPRRKLSVGHTVDNMRYKGGNPYNRENWEEVK